MKVIGPSSCNDRLPTVCTGLPTLLSPIYLLLYILSSRDFHLYKSIQSFFFLLHSLHHTSDVLTASRVLTSTALPRSQPPRAAYIHLKLRLNSDIAYT